MIRWMWSSPTSISVKRSLPQRLSVSFPNTTTWVTKEIININTRNGSSSLCLMDGRKDQWNKRPSGSTNWNIKTRQRGIYSGETSCKVWRKWWLWIALLLTLSTLLEHPSISSQQPQWHFWVWDWQLYSGCQYQVCPPAWQLPLHFPHQGWRPIWTEHNGRNMVRFWNCELWTCINTAKAFNINTIHQYLELPTP